MVNDRRYLVCVLLAYALLLLYGTWFPLDEWDPELGGLAVFLELSWPTRIPRTDLIINLVVYIPLGLTIGLLSRRAAIAAAVIAGASGLALSSALELGQTYLPGRVTSLSDIMLNTIGAAAGSLIAIFVRESRWLHGRYAAIRSELRHPTTGRLGLLVLLLWVLSQWAPFVPSLDLGVIKRGLAPIIAPTAAGQSVFLWGAIEYLMMLSGLMALALRLFQDREKASAILIPGMFFVLAIKVPIMTRQLAPDAVVAALCVTAVTFWLRQLHSTALQAIAFCSLLSFQLIDSLMPGGTDPTLRQMNWVPFSGHMNSVSGVISLIEPLWLYAAYAFLLYPRSRRSSDGLALRLALLAPWTFTLEWAQRAIPGRYPDMTDVVVGLAAFVLAYSYPWRRTQTTAPTREKPGRIFHSGRWKRAAAAVGGSLAILIIAGRLVSDDQTGQYALPLASELANPELPYFQYEHPRLPAPGPSDWALLRTENNAYVERQRRAADSGKLYARILIERTEPGSIDLEALFNELMELNFEWRGHEQTIPIALAYDWLYDRWTPVQRGLLLQKTEQACEYQIAVIRDKLELSPYNVYLYNSPLQALMMAALAIHGDAPSGDCMRFTFDYWKNRVIPVWQQVMGRRGGWHEGGEYVGIGIGQAIHRLPAMWRSATGEDLFRSIPGIRGFLDFAVQRVRPDGTFMRLGDAAYVSNRIPDLGPLALEFRHATAYAASKPPAKPTPLGFPWGPLSDERLAAEATRLQAPLQSWFDGIGLLVARSDASPEATYLTFKAGNNYWSHMHLDQGAFTIYKGQALAIDSGVYFDYGGEHHLNYTYQTIAHNVVTVTDPEDVALMPGKEKVNAKGESVRKPDREIANDGGQRRVGSGWGRPAPLDLTDWKRQSEHYQTVGQVLADTEPQDDLVWINADLTPAYTNTLSRKGQFFDRTRRVEKYLRSFVYLRDRDLILIHDRLTLSKDGLRPRWLLHSELEPKIAGGSFTILGDRGSLHGQLLLPEKGHIQTIGGPGLEFFIGSKNYDQDGKALTSAARRKNLEPGYWRIEIHPEDQSRTIEYLVALRPSLAGFSESERVVLIDSGRGRSKQRLVQIPGSETHVALPLDLSEISLVRR